MTDFFDRHRNMLEDALTALETRAFWTPFPEIPSGKIYGETARDDGETAWQNLLGTPFGLPGHPEVGRVGAEVSPWGPELNISYPACDPAMIIETAGTALVPFAEAGVEQRIGALLEALVRLNRMSFLIGHATMHTTGQAFAMAFQAGGPHAQDRGLEAVATAYAELTRSARHAVWEKPQGKHAPLVIEKHWALMPRGIALTVGCNTFPAWNGYPGIFASLATGNPVIVKPHPRAILPLALTVRVLREVFAEAGLPRDAVLLAADAPGAEITRALVTDTRIALVDYTGSTAFADWIRANSRALIFTEEAGVNSVTITGTDNFSGMCANLAFSLSLYSGQMCTSPQNIYVPKDGIETDEGHKSFDEVALGIKSAIDALLSDADRAAGVCGTIVNPATLERIAAARAAGEVIRESAGTGHGRSATPLLVKVAAGEGMQDAECFGPVSFLVPCDNAEDAIARASAIAREKGAITAALYAIEDATVERAAKAFAQAGVNLSVNLTGNIYVNQSAAFSDFHVTGANPAGNASLTDTAFVASRFRRVMIRRPKAA
ncbi:phenylacetic acid degradation protein PaaN [Pseudohoeflea suaedae]|uniref:Phenylacetic acid degradation protein PaaN n=1 Tax=Pseudohoeflea suaedae TaxID=877384 RepID=A0A4R5PIX8_9HYPH|nr:phenylacetic acid degradation protein PaaN [Pseudohoeflea suaedae]TDH35195.1 phenylacetic acid degradation protein PaaN [Pseudohoeflea suaedae]